MAHITYVETGFKGRPVIKSVSALSNMIQYVCRNSPEYDFIQG